MQTEKRAFRDSLAGGNRHAGGSHVVTVDELRQRFAVFRRENPRNTRIPGDLRAAVIAAMRRGVTATRLRRTCDLSASQLARWRAAARGPERSILKAQRTRVFSVVGEAPPRPRELPACPKGHGLELRLGPWSVSVRLAELPDATRG